MTLRTRARNPASTGLRRRDFLAAAAGAAVLAGLPRAPRAAPARRPNILLIQADDHRHQALGCMGDPVIQTPHLDALAERGVLFTRNVCQATYCIPSRISLLTGSYPHNNGFHSNFARALVDGQWTLPAALRRSGYRCGLVGKNHLKLQVGDRPVAADDPGLRAQLEVYGFDDVQVTRGKVWSGLGLRDDAYRRYLAERDLRGALSEDYAVRRKNALTGIGPSVLEAEHHQDAFIAGLAIDWIQACPAAEPFFLWLNFVSPHTPCDAPRPWATMYQPREMPAPIAPRHPVLPPGLLREAERVRRMTGPDFAGRFRAAYYGMISWVDAQVGRVLAALEAGGRMADTVVVFCADQGEMAGDHGLYGKGNFFRGAINAPLLVAWPRGFRRGARVDQPVELLDLVPTFLEIAGAPEAERSASYGESLMPLLRGVGRYRRDAAFAEYFEHKMVVTASHKYVYATVPSSRLLFDLRADPDETRNRLGQPAAARVEGEMRERLLSWLAGTWRQPNSKPPRPAAA